ncbi:MAG: hypothetical protein ACYC8T_23675 [Myxococcaceae bacterium]
MNAELWPSEAVLYGLMIVNVLAVATGLLWAARRGHLRDLDDGPPKETSHGNRE